MGARRIQYVPVAELQGNPQNPKQHTDDIGTSIERFGYVEPVILDERTGLLIAGHGRTASLLALEAAGKPAPDGVRVVKGQWQVPVVRGWSSSDDAEASAMLIASNRLVEAGGWDDPALAALLDDLAKGPGLEGVGFSSEEVDQLLISVSAHARQPAGERDPDASVEPPRTPHARPGDVWLLGPHRLLCGDCRDPGAVSAALAGAPVHLGFTSPPYADRREYDEASGFEPIHPDRYVEWFAPVAANVAEHLAPDGSWFVNIRAGTNERERDLYVFDLVIAHRREWGWMFVDDLCWVRGGMPGHFPNRFRNEWEAVFHFARGIHKFRPAGVQYESNDVRVWDPATHMGLTPEGGYTLRHGVEPAKAPGLANPGNVLHIKGGSDAHVGGGHTAAFPSALPEWFIRAYTDKGDVVFDPFAGSGSTIIAAHRQERRGVGVELSASYCDLIAARFERFTDLVPVRESTGEPVSFLS